MHLCFVQSMECMDLLEKAYDQNLVAVASDAPVVVDVPVLDLNKPSTVLDFIMEGAWQT